MVTCPCQNPLRPEAEVYNDAGTTQPSGGANKDLTGIEASKVEACPGRLEELSWKQVEALCVSISVTLCPQHLFS